MWATFVVGELILKVLNKNREVDMYIANKPMYAPLRASS